MIRGVRYRAPTETLNDLGRGLDRRDYPIASSSAMAEAETPELEQTRLNDRNSILANQTHTHQGIAD